MNRRTALLLNFVLVTLFAFTLGYYLGTQGRSDQHSSRLIDPTTITKSSTLRNPVDIALPTSNNQHASGKVSSIGEEDQEAKSLQSIEIPANTLKLPADATVIEMMEFLLLLGVSENVDDLEQFEPTLDKLKNAVNNNPDNMQMLVDYFIDADVTSQAPYYITSVLQGSNIENKHFVLNDMINRLATLGTPNANEKLLYLVSSTDVDQDNVQIVETLKNIALYSPTDSSNRTYALDLLMPYHLTNDEKSRVVNELSFSLTQASNENVSYVIESIIRFSEPNERVGLASNYLADNNNFSTRVAILSTLHNGSIAPNETLKATLFDIAQNPNDPLNKHAKDTLMYVFELDNDEYTRLRGGG